MEVMLIVVECFVNILVMALMELNMVHENVLGRQKVLFCARTTPMVRRRRRSLIMLAGLLVALQHEESHEKLVKIIKLINCSSFSNLLPQLTQHTHTMQ